MKPYAIPRSETYNAALRDVLPGGVHSNFRSAGDPVPVRLAHGAGSRVVDVDGNEYVDLSAAYGALCLGHQHAEFTEALTAQFGQAIQVVNGTLELAAVEAIRRWFGAAEMMRFGLSGTETVSNAIRLARAFTGRQKVLRFGGHYHGSSDLLLGGAPPDRPGPPVTARGDPYDTEGRAAGIHERECIMAAWNDEEGTLAAIEAFAPVLACVLMEPICVNGGGVSVSPDFAAAVAARCRRYGIVLILDEVITGVRAGPGGAQAALGLAPDLFVAGKALSNGIPISVLAGRAEIMNLLAQRRVVHGGTYNGYPLGLRAIISTLDILSRDGFLAVRRAEQMTEAISRLFQQLAFEASIPFHVNRFGTIDVLHPGPARRDVREYASLPAILSSGLLAKTLQSHGVLLCPISRCYVTTAVAESDLDWLSGRIRATFAAVGPKLARLAVVSA